VAEAGSSDLVVTAWFGIWAPANLPRAIVQKLSDTVQEIMREPAVIERLSGLGALPRGSTSQWLDEHVRAKHRRWGALLARLKVEPE